MGPIADKNPIVGGGTCAITRGEMAPRWLVPVGLLSLPNRSARLYHRCGRPELSSTDDDPPKEENEGIKGGRGEKIEEIVQPKVN